METTTAIKFTQSAQTQIKSYNPFVRLHTNIRRKPNRILTRVQRDRRNQELLSILFTQARNEALPWVQDLVFPVLGIEEDVVEKDSLEGLIPTELSDSDSLFARLPNGIKIHYKERIKPPYSSDINENNKVNSNQSTVLLIHGFNGSTFSWRANMDVLADAVPPGTRIIAFDRPPFGLSDRPLTFGQPGQSLTYNPYELDGSLNITESLMDVLGVTGPIIAVGHSAGALIALELARRRPSQIKALGLVAPAVPTTKENSLLRRATFGSQLRFLAIRALLSTDAIGLRYVRRQLLKQKEKVVVNKDLGFRPHPSTATATSSDDVDYDWEEAAERALQEAAEGYTRPLRARNWDKAALLNLRAFSLPAFYDYSAIKTLPLWICVGDNDGALTSNARALAEIVRELKSSGERNLESTVQYKEMKECGHVPMEEFPAEFNAALISFLDTVI